MSEKMTTIPAIEDREGGFDMRELIEQAQKEAIPLEELERIKNEQDTLCRDFLSEHITLAEYNKKLEEIEEYPGVIQMRFITWFTQALVALGLPDAQIDEILAHENEHMVQALIEGCDGVYRIEFARRENGKFALYPAIATEFPEGISDEDARAMLRRSLEAPDDLSERDMSQLGLRGN
jgi:hypothetical protein